MTTITERACTLCGLTKPVDQFQKPRPGRGGFGSRCRDCERARNRLRPKQPTVRRPRHQDPVKKRANAKVQSALRAGRLMRLPCEVCGDPKTHAHHDDYSKPLDVRWLCRNHHMQEHWKPTRSPLMQIVNEVRLVPRQENRVFRAAGEPLFLFAGQQDGRPPCSS